MAKSNGCTMRAGPWDPGCGHHGPREEYMPYTKPGALVRVTKCAPGGECRGVTQKYGSWRKQATPMGVHGLVIHKAK